MWKQFLTVFLELPCLLCGRPASETVCCYCQRQLKNQQFKTVQLLSQSDLPVFAWGRYEGQLKRAITTLKYDNQPDLGVFLGRLLGEFWLHHSPLKLQSKITIIPIPLHREKLKTRGFNQTVTITRGFCSQTGYNLDNKSLIRVRNTQAMFGLNPLERKNNIHKAFMATNKLPHTPVLLLDDIYTTGATVREAAKVLRDRGVKILGVIALAKA